MNATIDQVPDDGRPGWRRGWASQSSDHGRAGATRHSGHEGLVGAGCPYHEYQRGDNRENQGKSQDQYRKEANALYAEFDSGVIASKQAREARQPVAARTVAGVISRKQPTASTTIYKS